MSNDLDLLLGVPQPSHKQNIGYALVDQQLTIMASNSVFQEWIVAPSDQFVGQPLIELFPELVGQEQSLRKLIEAHGDAINLSKIYRPSADVLGRYFDLQVETMFYFGSILLVTTIDVTKQALLEQQLRQERNELRLQIKERERVEAALQEAKDSLEKIVTERTLELRQANEWLQFELQERRRMEEIRTKLEEQLFQAQKMEAIGRLAGGVAHDFNNLLMVITGYCDLLLMRRQSGAEETQKNLEEIKKAADRAVGLTGQLLAFSRKQVLHPQIVELNHIVVDMEKMLRRLIGEDIELTISLAPNLRPIEADPHQLAQVLLNLAINARDAMPNGGTLLIETANILVDPNYAYQYRNVTSGHYVRLTVRDNGVGMSDEVQAHIFEPFFTTKEAGHGTGLGLATCFGIVRQSGGYIAVDSQLGHGTTFNVYLPSVEAVPPVTLLPNEVKDLPVGNETILLVEDEALVRDLAVTVLRQQGYTVLAAANGEEGLRMTAIDTASPPPDLLVTDVVMPRLSGKELADQLVGAYPNLKVLYISGYGNSIFPSLQQLPPGIAFLQKPFSPSAFLHKVREILEQKPL